MSARTSAFLWASAPPRTVAPLCDAVVEAFAAFDERPRQMWISTISPSKVKAVAFHAERLANAMRSDDTISVLVTGAPASDVSVGLYLRDDPKFASHLLDRRFAHLVAPVAAPDDPRTMRFLEVTCAAYPVAHGAIMRAASRTHAVAEGNLIQHGSLPDEFDRRIGFDSMNAPRALDKLRRLYPVTIIGPAIWATLPPLPAVTPAPTVRALGDCQMVTAWPELVDSHDPQFLLGTLALRRWLWPFTIQNPADEPDAIERQLKWQELLPW